MSHKRRAAVEAAVARLSADNDNLRATVESLTAACEHYVAAVAALQRMVAQQQVTMLMAPYSASQPPKEAVDARP